ncbi:protein-disulfide reductase DsbD family protein [Ohtaekwangia koreensis]|uniref:Thiol:disulfide interchange protein DsbD n=1 Tax=Ohtaekwangia koreensis TaxID=688867 RepID=A0A1T5LFG2_9BACT|nr:cytochrome c biogenesis protein CcdA [Ohtaekwangia koreensis]SKC74409.1 thiol:disulfide interchange protein DsbD [Ohtaekwangia koreensis]
MLKRILFSLLLVTTVAGYAQVLQPAKLTAETPTKTYNVGDVVELIFNASINKNWYIYSVDFDPDCGPVPMSVTLEKDPSFELVGPLVAIQDKTKHDKIFDCDVRIFEGSGEFRQKIKILSPTLVIKGTYEGQVCSEVEGKCVLFDGDLLFGTIKVEGKAIVAKKTEDAKPDVEIEKQKDETVTPAISAVDTTKEIATIKTEDKVYGATKGPTLDTTLVKEDPAKNSFLGFFLLAFVAGLAALLTPCVFPMIPMTVSFFTQGRSKFLALIYGLSIIIIYTLIGAAIAPLMGPETANHLSTEWLPNLIFFIVFIVFGLSFLGLFEITLPGTFINKVDQQSEKGGLIGVFFMAFTLVLVSFSCTGPLVGSILVSSAGGEFLKPIVGMFAFSLAFAIPFTLFAFFPGWLSSMPKSGGWLNAVKVVLGFIEIALAFKFLSIADQAFHWGILDREINIAIWIVIVLLIGVYLMKGFRLPGDTGKDAEDKRVSIIRLTFAVIAFTFVVYITPGMWGAPLKALAGYLPPMSTHDFDLIAATRNAKPNQICDEPKYGDFLHLPHGINGYFDYEQALLCARQQNKPVFIDFTGHGCTNCREMEAVVWSDPQVLDKLKNEFIVVALYVDDKTELPESEWYTSKYDSKVKKTIGKQNADLQIANLNNNAQPFYVLVGKDERVLVSPYGYDKSVEGFLKFLDEGKKKFKELY